jgi:hypothetical protein
MRKSAPLPRLTYDSDCAYIDVPEADAVTLQNYLYEHGIHWTVSHDVMTGTARLDVSDVGGEWAREVLRRWRR